VSELRKLSPQQRAYALGYIKGLRKYRAEMRAMTAEFVREIETLRAEYKSLVAEADRFNRIEKALAAEPEDCLWLH